MNTQYKLENSFLKLEFDALGRIVSFVNKTTLSELLPYPGLEDNWKIMVLTDGYPVIYIMGKSQTPASCRQDSESISFAYNELIQDGVHYAIDLEFKAWLEKDEARFSIWLKNNTSQRIREVWAPILGGFQGFKENGKAGVIHLAMNSGVTKDVLNTGLPGAEYLFVVEGETADYRWAPWVDMFSANEALYVSSDNQNPDLQDIRVEKYPPEKGTSGGSWDERLFFPPDTPRWMKIMVAKFTTIDPGEEYTMPASIFWPHHGDWHQAADHYRAQMDRWAKWPPRPSWLKDYVGWQHIIGKTYLNEVYFTFEQFTETMIEAQQRTGVDVLMLYGHTDIGCEGANFDLTPGASLGGVEGFKRMCNELHKRGMKVLIFTHRQSAVAMDRLHEFKPFEQWAFRDRLGNIRKEEWWKTTMESLTFYNAGTGPIWSRICPYCDEWWLGFLEEIKKLNDLGCDGVQMDTIGAEGSICYAANHGHKPGEYMMPKLRDRLAWLRQEVYKMNPEFLLAGEEFGDWMGQFMDLPYSRYRGHDGFQIFRYTLPEFKRNVAVGAYSYDQVNKGLMMGWGYNCEVEGLKKSILVCPEFADFIGEVNKMRRKYSDYLLNGRYIDTLKANVVGNVRFGVHKGPKGYAVVIWNQNDTTETCSLSFEEGLEHGILCEPGQLEIAVNLPGKLVIQPHRAIAVIAEK
jgi:hypothetical protein